MSGTEAWVLMPVFVELKRIVGPLRRVVAGIYQAGPTRHLLFGFCVIVNDKRVLTMTLVYEIDSHN
jgi:hypothetical protein